MPFPKMNAVTCCINARLWCLTAFISFSCTQAIAQNTQYSSLYTSATFSKTIDLSKPVGEIAGMAGVSPSGAVTYTIPIYTPAGTKSVQPNVSLNYSSQANTGIAGFGWSLSGLSSIARTGKNLYYDGIVQPTTYDVGQDAFTLDGGRLNLVSGNNGSAGSIYSGDEESYTRVECMSNISLNNPEWFRVVTKDGSVMEYGNSASSKFFASSGSDIMLWQLSKIIDIDGNYIEFKYSSTDRSPRLTEILYTGNDAAGLTPYNIVQLSYSVRSDVTVNYDAGSNIALKYLLDKIAITQKDDNNVVNTIKTYKLNYGFDGVNSLLKEITEFGGDETQQSLNSSIFLYGDKPADIVSYPTDVLNGEYDYFTGDFNADGKTDMLVANRVFNQQIGSVVHTGYELRKDFGPLNGSSSLMYMTTLPQNSSIKDVNQAKFYNFMAADYDKDGRDDILYVNSTFNIIACGQYRRKVSKLNINYTKSFNPNTSYTDFVISGDFPVPVQGGFTYEYDGGNKGNFLLPGDFDGDGIQDYILILAKLRNVGYCNQYPNWEFEFDSKAFFTSPGKSIVNSVIGNFGVGTNTYGAFFARTINEADKIEVIDFDGDGKMELLVVKGTTTYVLQISFTPNGATPFTASIIFQTNLISNNSSLFPGDFNGDKKTDFLVRGSNGLWNILYSTGTHFISEPYSFNQTVVFDYGNKINPSHKVVVSDFNGDGKADILHAYNYLDNQTLKAKFSLYYSKSAAAGSGNAFYYEQYNYNNSLGGSPFLVGDFNGDGRTDVVNNLGSGAGGYLDIVSIKSLGQETLLKKVLTGHGNSNSFDYRLLTDKSSYPYFYERETNLDNFPNENPFNFIEVPLYAAAAVSTPDGDGGTNVTTYNYKDAIAHRAGKGFMGFKKIISSNNITGISSTNENELNVEYALLYPIKQSTKKISTGQLLSETYLTYALSHLSANSYDRRYKQYVTKTEAVDYFNGSRKQTADNSFDTYGNLTAATIRKGYLNGSSFVELSNNQTNTIFSSVNGSLPIYPQSVTSVATITGKPAISTSKTFTYNNNRAVASITDFAGLLMAVTTSYNYDIFGNQIMQTVSSASVPTTVSSSNFDARGRFVLYSTTAAGTPLAQSETYVTDPKWGLPASVTSTDCLTTMSAYDAFGRVTSITSPDGIIISTNLSWENNGGGLYKQTTTSTAASPVVKVYYDKYGREVKSEKESYAAQNGNWHTVLTTYDARGNVKTKTNSFFPLTETPRITTYTFDEYNRPLTASDYKGTASTSYSVLQNGAIKVISTSTAGRVKELTSNAIGLTTVTKDDGGDLLYDYNSAAQQTSVHHNGQLTSSSTYDQYGRQIALQDVDAGTITYQYNAFGDLIQQQDAKGNVTSLVYDVLGRVTSKTIAEGTIEYDFYKDPLTGCSNDNLTKITNYNGIIRDYVYDPVLKRLSFETQSGTGDGLSRTTRYKYNIDGSLRAITYPSGVAVNNVYDTRGFLIEKYASGAGIQTRSLSLYSNPLVDGEGKILSYTLGNGKTTTNTYSGEFPTSTSTFGVQNLSYSFNQTTANLMQRTDAIFNQQETFTYDNLDRLTSATVNNVSQFAVNYDGSIGNTQGNIIAKSDAGYYKYQNAKKHAVAYVVGSPIAGQPAINPAPVSSIWQSEQNINYTSFNKVASINEGYAINYDIEYGADYERVTSQESIGRTMVNKYYDGDYEERQVNFGESTKIIYVSGGNGFCAMLVTAGEQTTPYFIYTDHLGSIVAATDQSANIVARQNYDAWGRERNPTNWNQYGNTTSAPDWLYRGYTGHEMLSSFALINMNGRMYDPVLGRMLSPDNYVMPGGTQGHNRYTYALNNPLKYTDPDGNFVHLLVGALIGSVVNVAAGLITGSIKNFGDGIKAAAFGAVQGALAAGIGYGGFGAIGATHAASAGFVISNTTLITGSMAAGVASSFFPSIPIGDHFSLSPAIAFGSKGLSAGLFGSFHSGNVNVGFGFNATGGNAGYSVGGGYDNGNWGLSYYRNHFSGGVGNQNTGTIGFHFGRISGSWENDRFAGRHDRWRTNGMSVNYGLKNGSILSIGSRFITGEDDGGDYDKKNTIYREIEGKAAPREGSFYASYYNTRGLGFSLGFDSERPMHRVQNAMHDFLRSLPGRKFNDWYFPELHTPSKGFARYGNYNSRTHYY